MSSFIDILSHLFFSLLIIFPNRSTQLLPLRLYVCYGNDLWSQRRAHSELPVLVELLCTSPRESGPGMVRGLYTIQPVHHLITGEGEEGGRRKKLEGGQNRVHTCCSMVRYRF
jgi:hypothetical protein